MRIIILNNYSKIYKYIILLTISRVIVTTKTINYNYNQTKYATSNKRWENNWYKNKQLRYRQWILSSLIQYFLIVFDRMRETRETRETRENNKMKLKQNRIQNIHDDKNKRDFK
jgi:hypothetical protein